MGATKLQVAIQRVEADLSKEERDAFDRTTRESYKDEHKRKAFEEIRNVSSNLSLHQSVVERSFALFAAIRDDRDRMQRDKLVITACIVIAQREAELERVASVAEVAEVAAKEAGFKRKREEMKAAKDDAAKREKEAAVASGPVVPMKDWDEAAVAVWMRTLVLAWTPETLASWGEQDPAGTHAALASELWLQALLMKLQSDGRPPGLQLVLITASKIGECVGSGLVGEKIFAALKREKEKERAASKKR